MHENNNIEYSHLENSEIEEQAVPQIKRDTSKIYFFILAIAALIATNIYFYAKYKSSEESSYNLSSERVYMQDEIDRIEAELNRLGPENTSLNSSLQASKDSVRHLISSLRERLNQHSISNAELEEAQEQIIALREEVNRYKDELQHLKSQNAFLISERESLVNEVQLQADQLSELEDINSDLHDQIKSAAVLKLSNINIIGIRERTRERESVENKARRLDKLRIMFSVADNSLVESSLIDVYIRVVDPNGNLITNENQLFELSGNPMQYTGKTSINFTNQGESYTVEWKDQEGFKKGTYTIVLYTNNSTMGRSSIVLN